MPIESYLAVPFIVSKMLYDDAMAVVLAAAVVAADVALVAIEDVSRGSNACKKELS